MTLIYRQLIPDDAGIYLPLRLRAVREEPGAFTDSEEEVAALTEAEIRRRLGEDFMAGAFDGGRLVGMAGYFIYKEKKYSHRGYVHGVYLLPDYRGRRDEQGETVAGRLMRLLMDHARGRVEQLELSANEASPAAVAFYKKLGFEPCGRMPRVMKLGEGRYVDDVFMRLSMSSR